MGNHLGDDANDAVVRVTGETEQLGRVIGLVGCVKEKATTPRPAEDLYTSTLFTGRRTYVERSCTEWWILSAEHGLVGPDQMLAPYDLALKSLGRAERRRWSRSVLDAIDQSVHPKPGDTFEFHAGAEYRDFGVADGLTARDCSVTVPTLGMPIGSQLRFYKLANEGRS